MQPTSIIIGSMKIIAGKLQEALKKTVPTQRKNARKKIDFPITISYDPASNSLSISESYYNKAAIDLTLPCEWPGDVQLDGVAFKKVIATYKPTELLEIISQPDTIEISNGLSKLRMPRKDGFGKATIITTPIPMNPKHKGKPAINDEPHVGRVELDHTWDFSARMPVPHHQYPDSQLPPDKNKKKDRK